MTRSGSVTLGVHDHQNFSDNQPQSPCQVTSQFMGALNQGLATLGGKLGMVDH